MLQGAAASGRPRSVAILKISGLNNSTAGADSATAATHSLYWVVRTIRGQSNPGWGLPDVAGAGGSCKISAPAPQITSITAPRAAKQTRMPQAPPTPFTNSVKNAPDKPIATPATPVAQPFLSLYHFCAQASTAGAKNALPSPAGRLYTSKNSTALATGTSEAAKNPPASSAVPQSPAKRGPWASCNKPPIAQPTP